MLDTAVMFVSLCGDRKILTLQQQNEATIDGRCTSQSFYQRRRRKEKCLHGEVDLVGHGGHSDVIFNCGFVVPNSSFAPHFCWVQKAPLLHCHIVNRVIFLCVRTTFIVFFANSDPADLNLLFWKGFYLVKKWSFLSRNDAILPNAPRPETK